MQTGEGVGVRYTRILARTHRQTGERDRDAGRQTGGTLVCTQTGMHADRKEERQYTRRQLGR